MNVIACIRKAAEARKQQRKNPRLPSGWRGRGVFLFCIVVKIPLNVDDGRTLVAAAGAQIAEGADQVRKLPGRGALGGHLPLQVLILLVNLGGDGGLQLLAGEVRKVVVGQVF